MTPVKILFIADDFTGASDTLATLARAGLATRLYPRIAGGAGEDIAAFDAVGVATGLRGMAPEEGRASIERLAGELAPIEADFTHLKICSTFDSAPDTGNICTIADVLARERKADWIAIVGGQPTLGRYCIFGTLFAAAAGGTVHRIDRHPVMKAHPVTPMKEADLRRHLARQGWGDVGLVDYRAYDRGTANLVEEMLGRIAAGERRTLLDVSSQADIGVIGSALEIAGREKRILCIGASSVAEALTWRRRQAAAVARAEAIAFDGPVFALAGSRSSVTASQVGNAQLYQVVRLDPADLAGNETAVDKQIGACAALLAEGAHVLAVVTEAESPLIAGRKLAEAAARFAADVVARSRPGCLVVAGGDTSSAAVSALGIESIAFVSDLQRGLPLVEARGGGRLDRLPMVLKGGQMGSPSVFDDLARLSVA